MNDLDTKTCYLTLKKCAYEKIYFNACHVMHDGSFCS